MQDFEEQLIPEVNDFEYEDDYDDDHLEYFQMYFVTKIFTPLLNVLNSFSYDSIRDDSFLIDIRKNNFRQGWVIKDVEPPKYFSDEWAYFDLSIDGKINSSFCNLTSSLNDFHLQKMEDQFRFCYRDDWISIRCCLFKYKEKLRSDIITKRNNQKKGKKIKQNNKKNSKTNIITNALGNDTVLTVEAPFNCENKLQQLFIDPKNCYYLKRSLSLFLEMEKDSCLKDLNLKDNQLALNGVLLFCENDVGVGDMDTRLKKKNNEVLSTLPDATDLDFRFDLNLHESSWES
jgi:hypothetical protein